jgi:hypothetical protein
MDPTNMNPNINKDGEIDQWLDSALRQYAKAEPRAGLEARVLANLRAEQAMAAHRTRWWWAFGTAAAFAAIVVGIWIGEGNRQKTAPEIASISTTPREELRSQKIQREPQPKVVTRISPSRTKRTTGNVRANDMPPNLASPSQPKLEQFPSPQPLSEQEQILRSYIANYPESAVLIARARADALQRDREQEAAAAAQDTVQ